MMNEDERDELIALRKFRAAVLTEGRKAFSEAIPEAVARESEGDTVVAALLAAVISNYSQASYYQARNQENLDKLKEAREEIEQLRVMLRWWEGERG